jgi:hypothetical protein
MLSGRICTLFLCAAAAAAAPAAAQKLYKYTDPATGQTVYTDKLPASLAGRASEQLSPQGTVIRRNEAALTPEQIAAKEAERKRKLEEELAAKEERRKNMALLNTYQSERDIDEARGRALNANEEAVKEAERRLAEAQKRKQALAAEIEFYKTRPMPAHLKQEIQVNEVDIKAQAELVDKKKKETDAINARYDEDLRRYRALAKGGLAGKAPAPVAATSNPAAKK